MNQGGWHDEWRVTGRPGPGHEEYEDTWSSLDPDWPGRLAETVARAFVQTVLETAPPWEVPPTLQHRRIFTGQWEDVDVAPRPTWRRHPFRRQGAPS